MWQIGESAKSGRGVSLKMHELANEVLCKHPLWCDVAGDRIPDDVIIQAAQGGPVRQPTTEERKRLRMKSDRALAWGKNGKRNREAAR